MKNLSEYYVIKKIGVKVLIKFKHDDYFIFTSLNDKKEEKEKVICVLVGKKRREFIFFSCQLAITDYS